MVKYSKSLKLSILFSTVIRAAVVAKLVILDILPLTLFILALRAELLAKLVILSILPLSSFILASRAVLMAIILYDLAHLNQ